MNQSPQDEQTPTVDSKHLPSLERTSVPEETDIDLNSAQRKGEDALHLLGAVRDVAPILLADLFPSSGCPIQAETTPTLIGRFQIVKELGRGAHGVVFLAHDPDLRRDIALKVPRPGAILSPDFRRRFEREAKATALLDHPNIVPIHEFGSIGPLRFIASSLCRGLSLDQWRAANSCDQRLAAEIIETLAAAVQHAHDRGVLHRDIKPGNILIDVAGDETERWSSLQLTDFGLAQVDWDAGQTQSNALLGTPAYMAPEQAVGLRQAIGPATDVYALGATLYYLITKSPPILRESDVATLQAIQLNDPKSPRSVDSSISSDLEAICQKCLEKKPSDRYSTAEQLRADLRRFLNGQTVTVRPVGFIRQLQRWVGRNQSLAVALGTLAAVLICATIFSTFMWMKADRRLKEARSQATWSRLAVEQLLSSIANDPTVQHGGGLEKFRQQLLTLSTAYFEEAATIRPRDSQVTTDYIRSVEQLASSISKLGEFSRAIQMRDSLLVLADDEFELTPTQRAELLVAQATDHAALGNVDQAVRASTLAYKLFGSSNDLAPSRRKDARRNIRQLISLTGNLINKGDLSSAAAAVAGGFELAQSVFGTHIEEWPADKVLSRLIKIKCAVAVRLGRWDEVTRLAPVGIAAYEQLLAADPTYESSGWESLASLYKSWSAALIESGQLELAKEPLRLELQYVDQLLNKHPDMPAIIEKKHSNAIRRGSRQLKSGQFDQARSIARETIASIQSSLADNPQLKQILADELSDCQSILALVKSVSSVTSSDPSLETLILQQVATLEEACAKREHAIDLDVKLGRALANLAFAYAESSQDDLAMLTYKRSLSCLQHASAAGAELGESSAALVAVALNYRNALRESGQIEEALNVTDECLQFLHNQQRHDGLYDSVTLPVRPMVVDLMVSRVDLFAARGLIDESVICAGTLLNELQEPREKLELALAIGNALARIETVDKILRAKLIGMARQCLLEGKKAGVLDDVDLHQAVRQRSWDSLKSIDELTSFFAFPRHDRR